MQPVSAMTVKDKKKPDAPGSKAPVGPVSAANKLYGGGAGKSSGPNTTSKADFRSPAQTVPQKPVETKGGLKFKKVPIQDGDQGEHNRKRKDIGDNKGDMRSKQSVDSQSSLERIGGKKLNPGGRGTNAESDRSASNRARTLKGMYPSAKAA